MQTHLHASLFLRRKQSRSWDRNWNDHRPGQHCPDAPGEPLQHELPVHHRGQQAGLRLGGEGPEAELGGADEEVEDGQHRVIHHLALRTPPPPQSNLPIAPLLGHESGKLILLHRIVTRKILNTICLPEQQRHQDGEVQENGKLLMTS